MTDETERPAVVSRPPGRGWQGSRLQSAWRAVRGPLAQSRILKQVLASAIVSYFRLVRWTNPMDPGVFSPDDFHSEHTPSIIALWHGQHVLIPFYYPRGKPLVIMVSRSKDAEINALVAQKIGLTVVRGSGGREFSRHTEKGGARALISLKRALDEGKNVGTIADIPHGTPREAGLGIITLGRISGRPIIPTALATSRRKVIEKSWDKTTINLPFGRAAIVIGEPIFVPADANEAQLEEKRRELTVSLNIVTGQAYRIADGTA